ncbi:MAG TPA: transketolase [Planctomycetaceae bacterium]|nr:transketolase [Planctomycetaceae bacterium]
MEHIARNTDVDSLREIARQLRIDALKMIHLAGGGHPGGSLSAADLIVSLYFRVMNIRPGEPDWPDRDRFVLSKGHGCPILYATLARLGYFDRAHLDTLRKLGSILQGHPDMKRTPGLDTTTGSLGQGLSIGLGMALMGKLSARPYRVFVMLGCGELDEGQVWEAAMCAAKYKTNNLLAIIDYNQLQLDGTNDEIMPLEPLDDKWRSFGWNAIRIDGHDFEAILEAYAQAAAHEQGPTVIIAKTVKGKGVSFMEDQLDWHGRAPSDKQLESALRELEV